MSTHGDAQRPIVAWLDSEAPDRAPSHLIEAARARVRTTPQRTGWRPAARVPGLHPFARLAVAATAVAVAAFGAVGLVQRSGPVIGPAGSSPSPTPPPAIASPSSPVAGGMWPQQTLEEVRQAQARADAGDPAYTWQADQGLDAQDREPAYSLGDMDLAVPPIVARFLREVLGWEAFLFDARSSISDDGDVNVIRGRRYLRCASGRANPMYPTADPGAPGAERCAPTIDDLRYESVSIDLEQPGWQGPDGIWVVSGWAMTDPFGQPDPRVAEAEVTARLGEWLDARIAGAGAEGMVDTEDDRGDGRCNGRLEASCRIEEVPLLYATSSGAPYERYEIERVGGPRWPYGEMDFEVRLFADDGATVVEQPILWIDRQPLDGHAGLEFLSTVTEMTENGRPVAVPFQFFDGAMTVSAARPWKVSHQYWNHGLSLDDPEGGAEVISFARPPARSAATCMGVPEPADAAALARSIRSCASFEATAPVDVIVGGAEAVYLDLALAPAALELDAEGNPTAGGFLFAGSGGMGIRPEIGPDGRVRVYLVDLPEGSRSRIMAITIMAPAARFAQVLEAAIPIVESIEFQTP